MVVLGTNPGLRWQSRGSASFHTTSVEDQSLPSLPGCCTCLHAALPLQAMDETSQSIRGSRNPLPKIPQGTYTDGVRLGTLHKLTCFSYTPGLRSLHGSDPYGGPSAISLPRRPSSLQDPTQTALPSENPSMVP